MERGGRQVLTDVNVIVSAGTRLGIVGENGRGKSTLLHVLAGKLTPDFGTVTRVGSLGVAEQELSVAHGRTVSELIDIELADVRRALLELDEATDAIASGGEGSAELYGRALDVATALDAWDADRRVDLALNALGAVTNRAKLLSELSVGERYRVRLACLLGAKHDFLLLDEPTNHLDREGLEFLTASLLDHHGGIVLVSHDRQLLATVANKILDLDLSRDQRPRLYGSGYSGYLEGRAAEIARWEQEYDRHEIQEARLADDLSAAQNRLRSGWRPPKGTGKHQRATRAPSLVRAVGRRLEELQSHAVSKPQPPLKLKFPELPTLAGQTLIRVDHAAVEGRMSGPISVQVGSGDRLLITGANGAGKSTLLGLLAGALRPDEGSVSKAQAARVSLVAQETISVDKRSVRAVYESAWQYFRAHGLADMEYVSLKSLGLFSPADIARPLAELSMGQQRRVDLALALVARPHVLLFDEPTNHLSIALVNELTEALKTTLAAVVVVSHDRQLQSDLAHWPKLHFPS